MRPPCLLATLALLTAVGRLEGQTMSHPDLTGLKARAAADSNAPEAHYSLAMGYWRDKKWDDAARELKVAQAIAPSYAEAWLSQATLFFARGLKYWKKEIKSGSIDSLHIQYLQALRDEHRAFLLDPMVDLAANGLSELGEPPHLNTGEGELIPGYHPWWIDPLEKGIVDMEQGLYPTALQKLQAVIDDPRIGSVSSTPDLVIWYHGLASAHSGDFRGAITDFRMLRTRIDRHIVYWRGPHIGFSSNDLTYMMATAAFRGGFMDEAIEGFHKVLEADFSIYMAHAQLARIYTINGDWDHAIAERRLALDANPDDSSLLIDLATTLIKAGRPVDAEDPLDEAGKLNPRDPLAPLLLGQVLEKLGKLDEAKAEYRRFLALAPASYATQAAELRTRLEL